MSTALHPRTAKTIARRETHNLRADLETCRNPRLGDPRPLAQIATLIEDELDRRNNEGQVTR